MAFDFTGKLVLVTGGSAGIGAEISKGIVAGGGHVIVCSRHEDTGRKFVEELGEGNFFYTMDIADAEGVKKTVAQKEQALKELWELEDERGLVDALGGPAW